MRLCSLDIEESIQIEFVKRIKESAREYLEATDSITRIGINQAGQKSNAVAKAVNQINELFGGKAAKIAFEDDGQKYIDIKPDPAFVDRVFKKYEEREDARNVQRQDAERSGITYDDWYLFKLKGNDNQATLDQVKAAKEWWDKSPLSKNIGLQEAFNVVNSNAFAQWTQYGITLFHGANYTDIYHEAFHGFSQLYLTKGQKQALYNEARKVLGSKLTDFQVEETLAEDFRKYVLSDGKLVLGERPERNTLFRKLLRFLKQLFGGVSAREALSKQTALASVQEMYDNLYKGYVLNLKPSVDNVQFGLLNKGLTGIEDKQASLTSTQSLAVVEAIDYFISEALDKNNLPVSVLFSTEETLKSVYDVALSGLKAVRSAVAAGVEATIDPIEREQLIEKLDALDFAINNYGDVVSASKRGATGTIAYHKKLSKYLDFKITAKSVADILDIDENDTMDYTQLQDRSGTEGTLADYADPVIMYTLRSIKADTKNYFGLPKLYSGEEVFKRVAKAVSGKGYSEQKMYEILKSSKNSILNQVADKLGDPSVIVSDAGLSMWTKFYQTFNKYEIPIKEMTVTKAEGKTFETFGRAIGDNKKVEREWHRLFTLGQTAGGEANPYAAKTSAGTVLNVTKLNQDFKTVTHANVFDYLQAIGIYFDDTVIVREDLKKFTNRVNTYLRPALNKIYAKDSKSPEFTGIANPVATLKQTRKDLELESNAKLINDLLDYRRLSSDKALMGQVLNAENKPQNEYSLNNTVTQIVSMINNPEFTYQDIVKMPHMASWDITKNPMLKGNHILGSVFNLDITKEFASYRDPATGETVRVKFGERIPGGKLELSNFNGVKLIDGDRSTGISTTALDPYSKFIYDMNAMLSSGDMELMRHASKSSAYAVKGARLSTKYNTNNPHLYVDINRFADDRGIKATVDLMKQHVANEVTRALTVINQGVDIPGYTDRAKELTLFGDILKDSKNELMSLDYTRDVLSQINANTELSEKINQALAKYVAGQINNNKEIFARLPFKSESLRNLGGVSNDVAVAAYTANALIHNLEVLPILYGDAALYNHAKDDFHKRNAGVASTGDVHTMNKKAFDHVTRTGFQYAKALAAQEGFTVSPFDGVLNVAVLEDLIQNMEESNPELFAEYIKAFEAAGLDTKYLEGYKETNAADGQGYISFDFYKASRQLLGKWSPQQEDLYKKIANGEAVDPNKILKTFPPLKYQYLGPIQTSNLAVYAFHKFSLFPLVPSVVKGTNLEQLHNQMVRQNVHYVTFKSGSKLADGKPATKFVDADGKFVEGPLNTYQVHLPFLKDQVNISDSFKEEVRFSTQLRKLILQYLYDGGKPVSKNAERLVDQYEALIEKQVALKLEKLYTDIGIAKEDGDYTVTDTSKLLTYLKQKLEQRQLPQHIVDYVEQAGNGNLKSALDFSLAANEIEKALYSIVANEVIRTKVNGESLVQVSGVGFEKIGTEGESKLKFYRKAGDITEPMEVKIALQGRFKELLKLNHNDGKPIATLERLNEMIKKPSFNVLYKEMLQMIAVRIPVQGHNSMEFMQVAEFLPEESGISIVLPYEITTKSGGDFDIDKLTIMMPNIKVKNGQLALDLSEDTIEGVENNIIQSVVEILESPENFVNLIRPNATDMVKPIADEFAAKGYNKKFSWSGSPIKIIETGYNLYKHESNAVGKRTLGIGAVDNTNNTLMNRTGFKLSSEIKYKFLKRLFKTKNTILLPHNSEDGSIVMDRLKTVNGESIGDVISQLMNGWVDVEKDAWIFEIQGNDVVGPVMLFMLQSGVPVRDVINFVSNPLVKLYVEEFKLQSSPFNFTIWGSGESKKEKQENAAAIVTSYEINSIELAFGFAKERNGKEFSKDELAELSTGTASYELQLEAFTHFLQLEAVSNDLTQLKLSSNFDTKAFNNSFALNLRENNVQRTLIGNKYKVVPETTAFKYYDNKILNSFAKASYSQKQAWDFFAVRNNSTLVDFITKTFAFADNKESGISNAISQVFTAVYQDALLGADLSAKEYKGLPIQKVSLEAGAAVKNGILYVDPAQLRRDLQNINTGLAKFGRARVNPSAFNFKTIGGKNSFDQYYNFTLEREYLRSITPKLETETQEQYEAKLRDAALRNSNNLWYMFSSSDEARSYASTFTSIVERHPELISQYPVLDDLVFNRSNGIDRIKLSTRITEAEVLDSYHDNLVALADPSVQKVSDAKENKKISDFFSQFTTVAFLQNGFTSGEYNLSKIAPDNNYSTIMQQFIAAKGKNLNEYLKSITKKLIDTDSQKYIYRSSVNNYLSEYSATQQNYIEGTNILLSATNYTAKNPLETAINNPKFAYAIPLAKTLEAASRNVKNAAPFKLPSVVSLEEFRESVREAFQKLQYLNSEGLTPVMDSSLYSEVFEGKPEYYTVFIEEFTNTFGVPPTNNAPSATYREAVQTTQDITDQDVLDLIKNCKS
jgi:hypothetical protein